MKSAMVILALCCVTSASLAQVVEATVCDVLRDPESFDSKVVRIRGTVAKGFEEFVIRDSSCEQPVNAIWLAYPEGSGGKAGPVVHLRLQAAANAPPAQESATSPVKLVRGREFKQFDSLLSTPHKARAMCLGCNRYVVTATLTGRLDGSNQPGIGRSANGEVLVAGGFGHMNRYPARLVLQSVADVSAQEIDYSEAAALTKSDSVREFSGDDPIAAARQGAKAFPAGSAAVGRLERAGAAYGKPGDKNGVVIGFGVANELPKDDGRNGSHTSPDGLLFICTFDTDRLRGEALLRAIVHLGAHIAEVRGEQMTKVPFEAEFRAWETTVLSALATGQKTLTLSGGHVVWDASWPSSERAAMVEEAILNFLTRWTSFRR